MEPQRRRDYSKRTNGGRLCNRNEYSGSSESGRPYNHTDLKDSETHNFEADQEVSCALHHPSFWNMT